MSSLSAPEPLTPAGCDVRGLDYMPLDVVRFLRSDLVSLATPAEGWAALQLWLHSWLEVPAASLLNNERVLAKAAGVSLAEWQDVREMALRNWVCCSDGRIYHPQVAEKALVAWIDRLRLRRKSAEGNRKQGRKAEPAESFDTAIAVALDLLASIAPEAAARFEDPRGRKAKPHGSQEPTSGDTHGDTPLETRRDTPGEAETSPRGAEKETEVEVEVEVIEVGGGVARERATDDWPSGPWDKLLVAIAASPWLDLTKSLGLVTSAGRIAAWRREGASWEFDVVPVVTGMAQSAREPIGSWTYFDRRIARTAADNRKAMEAPLAGRGASHQPYRPAGNWSALDLAMQGLEPMGDQS